MDGQCSVGISEINNADTLLQILNITTNALPIILLNTVSVFFIIIPLKIPIFSQITKSNAC